MAKDEIIRKAGLGEKLTLAESREIFSQLMDGGLTEAETAGLLMAIRFRGMTADEIAGAAGAMNERKVKFLRPAGRAVDTCGSGGDGKSTLNVSTAAALVLASLGVPVAKHGNTAQSGRVGSADILRLLGLPVELTPEEGREYFVKHGFVFMFAQKYHPAMKHAGKVRRELRVPTIFNVLGPLSNPADPEAQIIGLSRRDLLPLLAEAALKLGRDRVIFYSSRDGYDEVSTTAPTECLEISGGRITEFLIEPGQYVQPRAMEKVADEATALELFLRAISGEDDGLTDLLAINAALALKALDGLELGAGVEKVRRHIKSGKVREKIRSMGGKC